MSPHEWRLPGEKKRNPEPKIPKQSKEDEEAEIDKLLDEIFATKPSSGAKKSAPEASESESVSTSDSEKSHVDHLIDRLGMNNPPPVSQFKFLNHLFCLMRNSLIE